MKKLLFLLLLGSSLAYGAPYTKEDRVNDMNSMASAMNVIQSGFFYNNFNTVAAGVSDLSDALSRVKTPSNELNEKDVMSRYMNAKIKMSKKIIKKINQKALTILQRFKAGDSTQAVQAYTKIMGQCMKCHNEMRNW